jgi:iron(III) transport system ATP-binding protein
VPLRKAEAAHAPPPAAEEEEPAGLTVEGLTHRFGDRVVVNGVGFAIAPGEVHCLVGPSGCGKTTTLRLIAGLERVQAGRIAIGGEVVAEPGRELPPERRRVGLMFQDFALFPHLRVVDNVAFGLRGMPAGRRRARALELLTQVNMQDHAESYPHTLSGGEQQRVALARALAPRPRLMLLDEPFSSLDATLREQVRADAIAILKGSGTPTLLVTHDADEALRAGDRIHAMVEGRIVQSGTPRTLYEEPATPFVAGFFGPVNRFKGWVVGGRVSTALGPVEAPDLEDGAPVDVVIRPEAVSLYRRGERDRLRLRVVGIRDLGPTRLVTLEVPERASLTVRVTRDADFLTGEVVAVGFDPHQVFVYPSTR